MSRYDVSCDGKTAGKFTIDVAVLGSDAAPAIVVSSGLHGVEGFLGSAIQLAMLEELKADTAKNIRWVFIHAINPFGFAQIRRFNEDNVDLNRNFCYQILNTLELQPIMAVCTHSSILQVRRRNTSPFF